MSETETVFRNRSSQVANYLRERLCSGYWRECLPSERELARQLGVGRQSIRGALRELQHEGLIASRTATGTRVVSKTAIERTHERKVGLVVSHETQLTSNRMVFLMDGIRRYLEVQQVGIEIHKTRYLRGRQTSSHFKKLLQGFSYSCWALLTPTPSMQEWCQNHCVPSMVIGAGDDGNALPNVSIDYYALAYHAVGEILRRGHRRLGLILPKWERGEEDQSRLGVQAAMKASRHQDATFTFETHDQTPQGVCHLADRLLSVRPRVTAWLICRHWHFMTILTYLQRKGVRVPDDISLVSRDSDDLYGSIIPEPTHYVTNPEVRVRQYARLMLRVMSGQSALGETVRLMPRFVPGGTLGYI